VSYREAARKLSALGCQDVPRRGGETHRKWTNPATNRSTVLPDHGSKDLKLGKLRAAVRQLGLDWGAFDSGGRVRRSAEAAREVVP
jgi:predicted RNA binding protein YcfA (HicA-like mRNA interferase family)